MGLVHHLSPQRFALGHFAKVALKPLCIGGSFPVLFHCFLAKSKDHGEPVGVLALLSIIYQSYFKLSTQREDLCHAIGLSQCCHLCSPLFSKFTFFHPILRDSAMNLKSHLIKGFI